MVSGYGAVELGLRDHWDHEAHRGLFPSCLSCHAGIVEPERSVWPRPESCENCHDGEIEETVEWQPPTESHRTNLAFDHFRHAEVETAVEGEGSTRCVQCHSESGGDWLAIKFSDVQRCLDCHEISTQHFEAPDTTCSVCHLPLSRADRLLESDISEFQTPSSHDKPEFLGGLHGELADQGGTIAASCATCHARDYCVQCHVDAPEQEAIQSLEMDSRSLVFAAEIERAPSDHDSTEFLELHGESSINDISSCATCHTQESCLACHVNVPTEVARLPVSGVGRGIGVSVERSTPEWHGENVADFHGDRAGDDPANCSGCHVREDCLDCHRVTIGSAQNLRAVSEAQQAVLTEFLSEGLGNLPPVSHGNDFGERHGIDAIADPGNCASCHVREDCLSCHLPTGASSANYHTADYITRHPAAAYAREVSCESCHNTRAFCTDCHVDAGLSGRRTLSSGFHDASRAFSVSHGRAARQSLESCVSCHSEQDCMSCHSAQAGRRFSPHGPGFDADRLRRSNSAMCTACHGANIPAG